MAIDKDRKSTEPAVPTNPMEGSEPSTQPARVMPSAGAILTAPIVMTLDKRRRKSGRRRYTSGTKSTQKFLYGVSKAGFRVTDSFSRGFNTFVNRSDRSAKKRKDGYVRDSLENASRGVGRGLSTLGRAPYEIARRIPTRAVWNSFRVLMPFGN